MGKWRNCLNLLITCYENYLGIFLSTLRLVQFVQGTGFVQGSFLEINNEYSCLSLIAAQDLLKGVFCRLIIKTLALTFPFTR